MSESNGNGRVKKHPIHVSAETLAAISAVAERQGISKGEAADALIKTAVSRRASLKKWYEKIRAEEV